MTTGQTVDARLGWLIAQLDEVEAVARATMGGTTAGVWTVGADTAEVFQLNEVADGHRCSEQVGRPNHCDDTLIVEADDTFSSRPEQVAAHIAANDPARVLRTVVAHRKVLEIHRSQPISPSDWHPSGSTPPDECVADEEYPWPCPTVQAIASIYSDVAGYDEHWSNGG